MFICVLQSAIISILFIFLIHYLVKFFKNTLTTPKIKDFVTLPSQKYKKMFDTMNSSENMHAGLGLGADLGAGLGAGLGNNDVEPQPSEDMKTELKNFMKKHLTEEVSEFSFSDASSFSEF